VEQIHGITVFTNLRSRLHVKIADIYWLDRESTIILEKKKPNSENPYRAIGFEAKCDPFDRTISDTPKKEHTMTAQALYTSDRKPHWRRRTAVRPPSANESSRHGVSV
jgi:hypothetical protein